MTLSHQGKLETAHIQDNMFLGVNGPSCTLFSKWLQYSLTEGQIIKYLLNLQLSFDGHKSESKHGSYIQLLKEKSIFKTFIFKHRLHSTLWGIFFIIQFFKLTQYNQIKI